MAREIHHSESCGNFNQKFNLQKSMIWEVSQLFLEVVKKMSKTDPKLS